MREIQSPYMTGRVVLAEPGGNLVLESVREGGNHPDAMVTRDPETALAWLEWRILRGESR